MKDMVKRLTAGVRLARSKKAAYKNLQKHLDAQPVGYPSTWSGVELRILAEMFTPQQAGVALALDWRQRDLADIVARARDLGRPESDEELFELLEEMAKQGGVYPTRRAGVKRYALHPLAVGMYEARLKQLTPSFYLDLRDYYTKAFGYEMLATDVPQMRVLPVERSVDATQRVSTYDEIRALVEQSPGRISIAECICRKAHGLINEPCGVTGRTETCMGFRDYADNFIDWGFAREISKEEAFEILAQNEKDGLMLISATMQEPQFVCSCCGCCCGITELISTVPRPADFAASNYQSQLNPALCTGCGKCIQRCQVNAIDFDERAKRNRRVKTERCIGCGLCVATCKKQALTLKKKPDEFVPPRDHHALYAHIEQHKLSTLGKTVKIAKTMLGRKV